MSKYIGSSAVNLSTTSADVTGNADIDGNLTVGGNLTVSGTTITVDHATAQTVDLGDGDKIRLGDDNDLQIFHNATDSIIADTGDGELRLRTNGAGVRLQSTSDENLANFAINGAVTLYHNNAAKLATTSTGVDITGTLTSDGLTLGAEGQKIEFSTSSAPRPFITSGDTYQTNGLDIDSDNGITLKYDNNDNGAGGVLIKRDSTNKSVFLADSNGDISFYNDSGNAKLFWDASAESLGVGGNPTVLGGQNYVSVHSPGSSTNIAGYDLYVSGTREASLISYPSNNEALRIAGLTNRPVTFHTNNAERIRIESGGDVKVEKNLTVKNQNALYFDNTVGYSPRLSNASDQSALSSFINNSESLRLNSSCLSIFSSGQFANTYGNSTRTNLQIDGSGEAILTMSIGGAMAGYVNAGSTDMVVAAKTGSKIRLIPNGSTANEVQITTGGNIVMKNGSGIDFGASSGSNSTSTLLDDYEEGNFTPTVLVADSATGVTVSHSAGTYTKVGRVVSISLRWRITSKGSNTGNVEIGGLPFTVANQLSTTSIECSGSIAYVGGISGTWYDLTCFAAEGTTKIGFYVRTSTSGVPGGLVNSHIDNIFDGRVSIVYYTDS